MIIRQATIADAADLVAAEQETARTAGLLVSRPDELKRAAFEHKIAELATTGRYIVAESNGEIVGHALLDPMPLTATAHVLRLTIVVHPGFLGRGIGEALMRDLMDWAERTTKARKIELLVRATNARAIHLYSKLGFVEEGRFKNRLRLPDGNYIDDIAMAWFPMRKHD
ncbi:MAG: GNAT family N-acetyltransferase [Deltaproteobacteria bacterium]|nr:GNAT family N-acetyltransferase [Deltaproteobacteria bacterium]